MELVERYKESSKSFITEIREQLTELDTELVKVEAIGIANDTIGTSLRY